jgi:hypothetical protein
MFRHARDDVTYVRFAFVGELGERVAGRALDQGILRVLWLTPQELRARSHEHRSPLVMKCVEDYLRGQRYPLELVYTHPTVMGDR